MMWSGRQTGWRKWALVGCIAIVFGAITGVLVPQYFVPTVVQAGQDKPPEPIPWSKVRVAYLVGNSDLVPESFSLNTLPSEAQRLTPTSGAELMNTKPAAQDFFAFGPQPAPVAFDILVVDQTGLQQLDPTWIKEQMMNRVALVALNVRPEDLGALLGLKTLSSHTFYPPEGDFVFFVHLEGSPAEIAKAFGATDLFSSNPNVGYRYGYERVDNLTLKYAVDNLRFDNLPLEPLRTR